MSAATSASATSQGPLLVAGDVLLHHVFAYEAPTWTTAFDDDAAGTAEIGARVLANGSPPYPFFRPRPTATEPRLRAVQGETHIAASLGATSSQTPDTTKPEP